MPTVAETLHTSPGRTTTEVLTTGAGTVAGNTLLIIYASDFYTLAGMPDPTSSAGALQLIGTIDAGDNVGHIKAYLCPVSSDGAKTVTIPAHIDCDIHGTVVRLAETVLVDQAATAADASGGSGTGHAAPSVTTTGPGRLEVCAWLVAATGSFTTGYTPPGSMAELARTTASPFSSSLVASEAIPGAGATGTRTANWEITGRKWAAITIALAVAGQTIVLAQAIETDTAQPVVPAHLVQLAQAVETDTAQAITVAKIAHLAQAIAHDSALPLGNLVPGHHTTSSTVAGLTAAALVAGLEATSS